MKILFIAPLPEPVTGQSLACKVLFDALAPHHDISVININKPSLKSGQGSLHRGLQSLHYAWRAFRSARRADVIYFTIAESVAGNLKDMAIYLACLPHLSRMVIHLHGGAGMRVLMHDRPLLSRINQWFLRKLGGIILLGERHLDIFQALPPPRRIHLIPNFAQDAFFLPPADIDRKFAQVAPLRLLYLSNLIPGKGYLELLAAFELLSDEERRQLRIDFAGAFENPEDEASFKARIAPHAGLQYHGVVGGAAKADLLAKAHVFCLPTYYPYEGQPISILEAFASGCAVITTDHSGIFDVFEPGACGLAVEKQSPAAVAQALRTCLTDPSRLRAQGQHNRALADERFRVATYNFSLASLLETFAPPRS
ncbi:glycosyltransferase family 4 protein [Roseateles sp. BYS87W]|uniref:Glycosyltransferase family 4 protein n=1 Tax=Pelomonas baiyunensis TaxID=3299026 RepID=A0ABW7H3Q1_9BURK